MPGGPGLDEVRALLASVAEASDAIALEVAEYEQDEEQRSDGPDPEAAIEHLIEPVLAGWRAAR